jgi:hypothetical protein
MTIGELRDLLQYAEKMKEGIDPTTGIHFPEDTILNSVAIKRYNKKVSEILNDVIRTGIDDKYEYQIAENKKKIVYTLSSEKKSSFLYDTENISISALVYRMNGLCEPYMKKVHAIEITRWLQKQGYLETRELYAGKNYKIATEKGAELGIRNEKRTNKYGNDYSVNLYNINAQKFIVENIEKILRE